MAMQRYAFGLVYSYQVTLQIQITDYTVAYFTQYLIINCLIILN